MRNVLEQLEKGYRAARRLVAGSLAFVMILSCMPAADVYAAEAAEEPAVYTQEEAQTTLPETESEEKDVLQEKSSEDAPADSDEEPSSDADTATGEEAAEEAETESEVEDAELLNEPEGYTVTATDKDEHPFSIEYTQGTVKTDGMVYVDEGQPCIYAKIDCDRDPKGTKNYGVRNVEATIGGEPAYVRFDGDSNSAHCGMWEISKTDQGTEPIDGNVIITVETEKVYFVEFITNQNADQIAINPDGGDFIANPNFNSEHGVYVYAGGTLSFHFLTNEGYRVTKVTQGRNGTELTASGFDLYKEGAIESSSYTTGQISANTTIYTNSEEKALREVEFVDRENSREAEPVPDGGDLVLDPDEEWSVYVYEGGKLSFHFKAFDGFEIKRVEEYGDGADPETEEGTPLTETTGSSVYEGAYTKTVSYTINPVNEDKQIWFQTEPGIEGNRLIWSNNKPYNLSILEGADPATGLINEGATSIKVKIWTDKSKEKGAENYGIVHDGVTALIDYDSPVDAFVEHDYGEINLTDGEYIIKRNAAGTAAFNDNVIIFVETKKVHFVGFQSGENAHAIGCEPVFAEVAGTKQYNHIGTSPWEGGVYVYDDEPMSFRLNPYYGFAVNAVRQGRNGEALAFPADPYTENEGGRSYSTGIFTTNPIRDRTFLYIESKPDRQVIFTNEDQVDYVIDDASTGMIEERKDQHGNPIRLLKADSGELIVKAKAKDGNRLTSLICRTVNFYTYNDTVGEGDEAEEITEIGYEQATSYAGKTVLSAYKMEGGYSYYKVPVPVARDGDEWSVLGLEISANVTKMAPVSIELKDADGSLDARLFDAEVRVGSQKYPITSTRINPDDISSPYKYVAAVPAGSDVTVSLTSKDDLWTVSGVVAQDDSTNSGKSQKPSKNGEYALKVGDNATLTATITPVIKLVITDKDYNELEAVKNVYTIKKTDQFVAYIAEGSKILNGNPNPNAVYSGVTFYNGSKEIVAKEGISLGASGCVLNTTGEAMNLSKLPLKAKYDNKTYTATLNFTGMPTKATVSMADDDGFILLTYGQKATIKVSIDGDTKDVEATIYEVDEDHNFNMLADVTDIGTFDGKTVTIDPKTERYKEVVKPCQPMAITFDVGDERIGYYYLFFTAPTVHDKEAPIVTENASLSTNQALGLNLKLPKGVKSAEGMYYEIEARIVEEDKGEGVDLDEDEVPDYYDRQAYLDDKGTDDPDDDEIVSVFCNEAVMYVPASEKSCVMNVSLWPKTREDGWRLKYNVRARLVYAEEDDEAECGHKILKFNIGGHQTEQATPTSDPIEVSTKDNTFETKLSLTKKLPSKIYNTQNSIPVAVPKWSKTTTVQGLDRVELINEYGNVRGHWSRWDDNESDHASHSELLNVDEESGLITLDTSWEEETGGEEEWRHLEAGKYTVVAYAIGGPGQSAKATLNLTLLESISNLTVTAPVRVLKNYNKAATVKAEVAYNTAEWDKVPATKSVEWNILQVHEPAHDEYPATYKEIEPDSPLYGMLTMKNGTVTVNAKLLVDPFDEEAYSFVIAAKAADYEGNDVWGFSDPIRLTAQAQIPTEFQFVWDDTYWDEGLQREVLIERHYSPITEEEIARREKAAKEKDIYVEPFYSNAIHNSRILVIDQYGEQMYATLKLSGLIQAADGRLQLSKPGKITITATATDGSKKSKKLQFTIANGDVRFKPNVLIQDAGREIDFENAFINLPAGSDRFHSEGLDNCNNYFPSNRYFYVHVAGIRYGDIAGKDRFQAWAPPDFGNNVMFDHSIKVSGGTIKETRTDLLENYTTYVILPGAKETKITLTDKTNDKAYGRAKADYQYTVTNEAFADNKKAATITADKSSILNQMFIGREIYERGNNPNHVVYTIKNPAEVPDGCTPVVRVYMDELTTDAQHTLSKFIGISDDENEAESRKREINGICLNAEGGKFAIDYFREKKETRRVNDEDKDFYYWEFFEIPAGTYHFYAVYGYQDPSEQFHPLNAPTKLSVKLTAAKNPAVTLASNALKLTENGDKYDAKIELPAVKDGVGILSSYELISANVSGAANRFNELFVVEATPALDENAILTDETDVRLTARDGLDEFIPIGSGKSAQIVHIRNWYELKLLKKGLYKTLPSDPDTYDKYGMIVGSALLQKKAYDNFVKSGCTGFLRVRAIGYDGRETEAYTKITVNIDDFVDATPENPESTADRWTITSTALGSDGNWAEDIGKDHGNKSPQIGGPRIEGANTYAVFMVDTTADNWLHWKSHYGSDTACYGTKLNIYRGISDDNTYIGPYPPSGTHTYEVYVVALKDGVSQEAEDIGKFDEGGNDLEKMLFSLDKAYEYDDEWNIIGSRPGNILAIGHLSGTYTAH